ncbi:MAG TPA: UbiA family prenyltransferase [Candidatus Paceibacterota bacterium]|nr:UbiA family prenyltransferase [Candidatus Paceibacterota bacterium]
MRLQDISGIKGATIILDIDGTLTVPGGTIVDPVLVAVAAKLREHNDVYLLSNRGDHKRDALIAASLGIDYITTPFRKPHPATLRGVTRKETLVVIGDKVLTDGLLALFTRARFIRVERLVGERDGMADRIAHAIDDVVAYAWNALHLMRPTQWVKNVLVFAPLFFAREFFNPSILSATTAAFVAFCFIASAGYIVNDVLDVAADRLHPHKKYRPLAMGSVTVGMALALSAALALAALGFLFIYAPGAILISIIYGISSVAYSTYFKRVPVIEMLGFIWFYFARVLAGSMAGNVPLSAWIVLAIIFLALFLVAAKRYAEKTLGRSRSVLAAYPERFLEGLLFLSAGLVVVFYGVYSVLGVASPIAVYSAIPVLAAILRYLQLAFTGQAAEYPEQLLLRDRGLQIAGIAWFLIMLAVFY